LTLLETYNNFKYSLYAGHAAVKISESWRSTEKYFSQPLFAEEQPAICRRFGAGQISQKKKAEYPERA